MQTKHLYVLIHIRNKSEAGSTSFSPPVKIVLKSPKQSGETNCFCSVYYCKSGNFRENFIFANSVKRYICDAKICDCMIYRYQ